MQARFTGDASNYLRTAKRVRDDARRTERDLNVEGRVDADTSPLTRSLTQARAAVEAATRDATVDVNADTSEAQRALGSLGKLSESVTKRANLRFRSLATLIGTGLPAASATASAAITGGVGAAFVALGAVGVRESERVQDAWTGLGRELSGGLAGDAAVLETAYVDAAERIGDAYDDLRPQFRRAFAASVPHVESLTDSVTGFAQRAMPGLVESVEQAGPVFDGLEIAASRLGMTVGEFAAAMSEYSEEAGQGIERLSDVVDAVLSGMAPIIGDLTQAWAEHGDAVADAIGSVLDVLGSLTDGAIPSLSTAVGMAAEALGTLLEVLEPVAEIAGPAVGTWLALAGAMKAVAATRKGIAGLATSVQDFGTSLRSADGPARSAKGTLAGLALSVGLAADEMVKLNPNVSELTSGLERFRSTGDVTGEVARLFGDDLGELNAAFEQLTDGGLTRFLNELGEYIPGMDFLARTLGESEEALGSLDQALTGIADDGGIPRAQAAFDRLTERMGLSEAEVGQLLDLLPTFSGALDTAGYSAGAFNREHMRLNEELSESRSRYEQALEALREYAEEQRAAADPVFALRRAVQRVGEAQTAYNEAVDEHTANSPEAREAAWTLAEAVSAAEQAALNGDLSFSNFRAKLAAWVEQGVIGQEQANILAGRVEHLRGRAEDYRGNYGANFHARTRDAANALAGVQEQLNNLDGRVATSTHNLIQNVITGQGGTQGLNNFNWGGARGGIVENGRPLPFASGGVLDANQAAIARPNHLQAVVPFIGDRKHDREYYIPDNGEARSLRLLQEANRSMLGAPNPAGMSGLDQVPAGPPPMAALAGSAPAASGVSAGGADVVAAVRQNTAAVHRSRESIDTQTREMVRAVAEGRHVTINVDSRELARATDRGQHLNRAR